ncbi:MAG: hypothetical protein KY447_07190 [Actinobacteria bacterium]|nr:hypothetical protein [Actinomycetota bacterium]
MWARPKPGFEVEVADDGPEEVEVRFESRDHESRITAFWKGATPSHEVREGD